MGTADRPVERPRHRLRDHPYEDELDQEFCEECETLCQDGQPCMCCLVEIMEREHPMSSDYYGAIAGELADQGAARADRHTDDCGCSFVRTAERWWQVIWCPEHVPDMVDPDGEEWI